jgi:hypothetical protein
MSARLARSNGRGGERPADVSQVVEVEVRCSRLDPGRIPDQAGVRPPRRCALGANEDQASLPGSAKRSRCQRSSGTSSAGRAMVRRPARATLLSCESPDSG